MNNVILFDVETTGLSPPEHEIIELGCVLWNVGHRAIVDCYSALLYASDNPAERWNGIHPELVRGAVTDDDLAWSVVANMASSADAVVAHSAEFDRKFAVAEKPHHAICEMPWICTLEDVVFPMLDRQGLGVAGSGSLVRLALAHGVGVVSAHRSIHDCLLLARLFEAVPDIADRLRDGLARAQRPKATFVADTTYEQKDLVKSNGFHWNGTVWHRRMAEEDAAKLPFAVIRAGA